MNIFNRVVVVLGLVAAIFKLLVFLLMPERLFYGVAADLQYIGEVLEGNQIYSFSFSLNWLLFVFLGGLVLVLLVILLCLELSQPRRPAMVRVLQVSGGQTYVSAGSIAQRLEHAIALLGGVLEVRPAIVPRRGAVDIALRVTTTPEVDIPAKTEEICQTARGMLETQMGLKLRRIQVRLSHGPYASSSGPSTPAGAPKGKA